ncbi:MAG: hypothetical protein C0507_20360 [Cyanobacteria bacterium PR.3.49]|nr:hypothetical protein [Cyanobacteria bacterium PR.3.49]
MVWTSDYPEGRKQSGSTPQGGSQKAGSAAKSDQSADSGKSANSGGAVATVEKPDTKSESKAGSGSGSVPDFAKPPYNPISGGKTKKMGDQKPPTKPGFFLLFGGVILPVAATAFELTTHFCARTFFDPFPTPAHVLLFSLIPLSNFLVWMASRRNMTDLLGALTLGTGMAMGVAILYSLMFLPVVPLSVLAILFFGFGLLSLSPLLAIPAVWKSSKYLVHLSKNQKTYFDGHQLEHIGHMIILCTVVAVELPSTLTRIHISDAVNSKEPAKATESIEWLRAFGNPEVMLRACYERSGRATDILGSLYEVKNPTKVDDARKVYYQVTGKPFNSISLPPTLRATRQNMGYVVNGEADDQNADDEFDQDPDIAGEAVSGVSRGLSMTGSRLSGLINGNTCIADLNWTITFGNTSKYDREVRSKILLPPGAVVTNAFLIVNNTEREAKIMGRSLARSRYRSAVAAKKDPLLVSTSGADTVLLQLYPVAPESKIGVRLHIVAPMAVTTADKAELALPTFEERNFQVDIPTAVDLNSGTKLASTAKDLKLIPAGIQGSVTTPELARFGAAVIAERDPKFTRHFASDGTSLVIENIKAKTYPRPRALSVVIDGSNGMSPHFSSVLKELATLPDDMSVRFVYVRDGKLQEGIDVSAGNPQARASALSQISKIACAGGQINLPAVTAELSKMITTDGGAVLWLHAAQPIPGKLERRLDDKVRKHTRPLLYDFAVAAGPNEVLSGLYACPALVRVDRGSNVQSDLHRLFEQWKQSTPDTALGGIVYSRGSAANVDIQATDSDIGKLVAFDEISKLQIGHPGHTCKYAQKAVDIATKYHLVTPFSSAIITEPIMSTTRVVKADSPKSHGRFRLHNPIGRDLGMLSPMPMMMRQEQITENTGGQRLNALRAIREEVYADKKAQSIPAAAPPVLQGATNGTVGAAGDVFKSNPMIGDQFSSAATEGNTGTQSYQSSGNNEMASWSNSQAESKLSAQADVGAKSLRAKESSLGKDSVDEGFTDEGAANGPNYDQKVPQSPLPFMDQSAASPIVPESDTYVLFGVGFVVLGFGMQQSRKLRAKKA